MKLAALVYLLAVYTRRYGSRADAALFIRYRARPKITLATFPLNLSSSYYICGIFFFFALLVQFALIINIASFLSAGPTLQLPARLPTQNPLAITAFFFLARLS